MNSKILVIQSDQISDSLKKHVRRSLEDQSFEMYNGEQSCKYRRILFVVGLNNIGYDFRLLKFISEIKEKNFFEGSVGSIIIESQTDLYTKSTAQDLILHTNKLGLSYLGHSVVEIVKDYKNFETWQKTIDKTLEEITTDHCKQLVNRLNNHQKMKFHNVLALHASSYKTSNTLGLWHKVKGYIKCDVDEIHIENGTVVDCKGCPFHTCMHYGRHHSCFYGGIMVEEVLPKIEQSDIIVWVCPNYNDSISANLLAVINRLTVLYRQISFHDKAFFAVVVSGNSGSDSVAKQLIGALNINKGFFLPAYFSIMAIANEPLKILEIEGIDNQAKAFADNIINLCEKNNN